MSDDEEGGVGDKNSISSPSFIPLAGGAALGEGGEGCVPRALSQNENL